MSKDKLLLISTEPNIDSPSTEKSKISCKKHPLTNGMCEQFLG